MKISDIMKKAVVISKDKKVREAAKLMSEKGIGSLIVVEKNQITGIITESDIVKNVEKIDKKISDIMTKKVISIEAAENLESAAALMSQHKIKKLPVVEDSMLVGIITATDIISNLDDINEEFFFD